MYISCVLYYIGGRVESYTIIDCFAKGKCFNIYTTILCTYLGNEGNSIMEGVNIMYLKWGMIASYMDCLMH